ncbi:hypothetical protein M758_8G178500 [Ceratodon purpureus]|nr:hypothetical protein M758_8G178500 [Ceratodon purpureus]
MSSPCGFFGQAWGNRGAVQGVAVMVDMERERMVVEERGPSLEVLSARGFNAGAPGTTDCSKPLVHDSPKLLPCETAKDEDMAAMRSCLAAADSIGMKTLQHIVDSLETRLQSALMHAVMQILETLGKDAAARVVMAERKASVMEQEHINTKQQALAMMLRIKHSSDSMLIDAEKRLLVEKRRSQELDAKVGTLQDTIRRMKAELKRKGDILDELQRTQLEVGARPGLMSPSEAVSKKRKGNPLVRLGEGKPGQPNDGAVEDECDDTATLLATMPTRSPSTDRPNSVLGWGLGQSTPRNSSVQEYSRVAPTNNKQGSPASLRRSMEDGCVQKTSGHRDKELNLSTGCPAERKRISAQSKSTRAKLADVEDDSSDQHDSSVEGLSQNAEKKTNSKHDSLVNGEDMDGIDDGFLGLIALQGASPGPLISHELQNGDTAPGLKSGAEAKEEDASDSSTDDEAEYQSKQKNAARVMQPKSDEAMRHKVPETTKSSLVEQTMVLRRSSGRIRRGKQHMSPEKSGPIVKEKEVKSSGDIKGAENSASGRLKGGAVDAADGSSALVVESSRDSRRLMQGARQVRYIFFYFTPHRNLSCVIHL